MNLKFNERSGRIRKCYVPTPLAPSLPHTMQGGRYQCAICVGSSYVTNLETSLSQCSRPLLFERTWYATLHHNLNMPTKTLQIPLQLPTLQTTLHLTNEPFHAIFNNSLLAQLYLSLNQITFYSVQEAKDSEGCKYGCV